MATTPDHTIRRRIERTEAQIAADRAELARTPEQDYLKREEIEAGLETLTSHLTGLRKELEAARLESARQEAAQALRNKDVAAFGEAAITALNIAYDLGEAPAESVATPEGMARFLGMDPETVRALLVREGT